jgi:glycosyltransferase involved in cell wall biosynthesis
MILICEMHCVGYEHVEVNAALIKAIQIAFPEQKLVFFAEQDHLFRVRQLLSGRLTGEMIEYQTIQVPERNASGLGRFFKDYKNNKYIYQYAWQKQAHTVFFLSTSSPSLIALKMLFRKDMRCKKMKNVLVVHGTFATIFKRPSLRPGDFLFWFKWAFLWGDNQALNYLLLCPAAEKQLRTDWPKLRNKLYYIDLPYFFAPSASFEPWKDQVVKFASFGSAHVGKGTHLFIKLAKEIKAVSNLRNKAEFILIGHLLEKPFKRMDLGEIRCPSKDVPLSNEDYNKYASMVDYAVFFNNPRYYKYLTSAALFDAFSCLKPVIALRSPLFEYYFELMGDIGYLCRNYEEIKMVISNLIENPPIQKYMGQRENIYKGRQKIDIASTAGKLKDIILDKGS